jgi:predicted DsbA family dithiol-disulfide isomerase
MAVVEVTYYTDPACPWSWAAEPALRRLLTEFDGEVAITYVMGGLARELTQPQHELLEALDAAAATGMPVDARGWGGKGGRAPRSTYPACLAVKAAAEQGLDGPYLRVLREGFWLRRAPLDSADALEDAARAVSGLDLPRFAIDLRSNAIAEAFGADLEQARAVPDERRSPNAQPSRVKFPTFRVGDETWLQGRIDPAELSAAAKAAGAQPQPLPRVETAVRRHGTLTTAEVAAVCDLPWTRAAAQLWALAQDFRLAAERVPGGELWKVV